MNKNTKAAPQSSPLPWEYGNDGQREVLFDADGEAIGKIEMGPTIDNGNAKIIVRRVNEGEKMDALLAASEKVGQHGAWAHSIGNKALADDIRALRVIIAEIKAVSK